MAGKEKGKGGRGLLIAGLIIFAVNLLIVVLLGLIPIGGTPIIPLGYPGAPTGGGAAMPYYYDLTSYFVEFMKACFLPDPGLGGGGKTAAYGIASTLGGFFGIVVVYVSLVLLIVEIVLLIKKHKKGFILDAVCAFINALFVGLFIYFIIDGLENSYLQRAASFWLIASFALLLASLIVFVLSIATALFGEALVSKIGEAITEEKEKEPALTEDDVRRIVKEELASEEKEEKPEEPKEEEEITVEIDEDQVRAIVKQELDKHVEELHTDYLDEEPKEEAKEEPKEEPKPEPQPEPTPVVVAAAEEEPEDEEEEGEEEGEIDPDDPFGKLRRKRRASFETRLKNSEYDLRHKYYDLRDYIKSYGVNNRISIPGDTFSAHRVRYAFITINGKHIKAFFKADPDKYADSPIPVKRAKAKKFEDLPLEFKVQSDLSFRRACKLVDDIMAEAGFQKKEEEKKGE